MGQGPAWQVLPEYMMPDDYVLMDIIPSTPNGKIDRKACQNPITATLTAPANMLPHVQATKSWLPIYGKKPWGLNEDQHLR
jgi:hypothetical protein